MAQPSKEPCKKQACDIQACLSKNNFLPQKCRAAMLSWSLGTCMHSSSIICRCVKVIQLLQSCCEQCEYKSTHCASISGLLKQINKLS